MYCVCVHVILLVLLVCNSAREKQVAITEGTCGRPYWYKSRHADQSGTASQGNGRQGKKGVLLAKDDIILYIMYHMISLLSYIICIT